MTNSPVVVRFGSLGDLAQLAPLLVRLHRATGARIDLLTANAAAPALLGRLAATGEIRIAHGRRAPYLLSRDQRESADWLRRRPGAPVCLVETVPGARPPLLGLLRHGRVAAAMIFDAALLERAPLEHTLGFLERVGAEFLRRIAPGAPVPAAPELPRLLPDAAETAELVAWRERTGLARRPLVVFHVTSRRKNRGRWPSERWAQLARAILEREPEAAILVSGTAAERPEIARQVAACRDRRVIDAAGELPIGRLLALLAAADSSVMLDSGPAHLAAAAACPLVVLHGMADPRRVAPRGTGPIEVIAGLPECSWPPDPFLWQRLNRLDDLTVDAVLAAWERVRSDAALGAGSLSAS